MSGMVDSTGRMLCVACGCNIEDNPDDHHCDPKERKSNEVTPVNTGRTFHDRVRDAELLRRDD